MKPSVILLGVVLGSSAAITFSLFGTAIIYAVLQGDYPRLQPELRPLLTHLSVFVGLTMVAALSFYAQVRMARWRGLSAVGLVLALVLVAVFYWPA